MKLLDAIRGKREVVSIERPTFHSLNFDERMDIADWLKVEVPETCSNQELTIFVGLLFDFIAKTQGEYLNKWRVESYIKTTYGEAGWELMKQHLEPQKPREY